MSRAALALFLITLLPFTVGAAKAQSQSSSAPQSSLRPAIDESSAAASQASTSSFQNRAYTNPVAASGIYSSSQGHESHKGIIRRALGGAASDVGHVTLALLSSNLNPDLPPDEAMEPVWPFKEPNRKTMFTVNWADGSDAKVSRLPDGSIQIIGSGKRFILQPEGDGKFAMIGDYGSFATVLPRPGGGYTIMRDDGRNSFVIPRPGGGFDVKSATGDVTAVILPGPNGTKHIRGDGFSDGFMQ
ncbi:MAG: hypothetical protein K2X27_12025 [Candidatus Obscuribacterales bacterium]|nr:hypothetical protein [Candidatus Obscuribacterales bacterium]